MSDADGTRYPIKTLEMDWSHASQESIARQALTWNPEGKRKRRRPRNTLLLEADVNETGYKHWKELGDWLRAGNRMPGALMWMAYAPGRGDECFD